MNIFEQQKANRRKTLFLIFGVTLFLLFLGFGYDVFMLGVDPFSLLQSGQISLPFGTLAALILSFGTTSYSYFYGDKLVLSSCGAISLDEKMDKDLSEQQVVNIVDEMKLASGLPRPKLYLIEDPDPNAFATGRDPAHASIAVTRGLLQKLNREELEGVIAHEMSHVRNYDIRLMSMIAALVGAIVLLSDWAGRYIGFGRRRRSVSSGRKGGLTVIFLALWLVLIILAPLIGQMMAMCVSRKREYLADASGAELTRNPIGLAKALEKISKEVEPTQSIHRGTAHLCIEDPLGRAIDQKTGFWADLFSTHPPIQDRIHKLHEMGYLYQGKNREGNR